MYKHYKNGYYISNKGKVTRIRNNRRVTVDLNTNNNGYKYFVIFNNDNEKVFLHRAVAECFIPKIKGKWIVDHIDRNKLNNKSSNLRWVNNSENMLNRASWKK